MQNSALINKRELQYLLAGILFLMAANIVDLVFGKPLWGITRFIYLGYDDNLSAWYSSMLLTIAGLLAYECSMHAKRKNIKGSLSLLLFAGLLLFMSADELARFHEILGGYAANYFGISTQDFAKHSAWVWVGGPLIIAIFLGFIFLLKKVFSLVPGSMVFLITGFSLIILGGVFAESTINFLNQEELKWVWDIEVVLEESLEMTGTIFISYALIRWRDGFIKLYQ